MRLNTKKTIFVGFAFLLICMFWQVYDTVIAKILIDSFGLNQTWSGIVMAIDNVLAIILLPIFGTISDKTNTKLGKRTPYILVGTILAAVFIMGVSIFDNLQNAKLQNANIPAIEKVEIGKIYQEKEEEGIVDFSTDEYQYTFVIDKDGNTKTKQLNEFDKKDVLYRFTYGEHEETDLYLEKELAVNKRSPLVADVRLQNNILLIAFLIVLCFALVSMAIFRTPAVSLMPDVTPKPLRSKANAIINLMGSAGGIIALGFMTFLAKDYHSYTPTFIVLGVLMLIFLAIFLWQVKEPTLVELMKKQEVEYGVETESEIESTDDKMSKDVMRSFILILFSIVFWYMAYNAATSKFSVYATNVLATGYTLPLLVAQAAAIITYIPIGMIASKVGRKKTVLVGVAILFSAFLLATFVTDKTAVLIWIAMALAGIGWATINVNSYPMVVEMSKGSNIGKYTGIYYTASMAAQIATPILSGAIMDIAGTMHVLFPYCVVFCLLAFLTMSFVKHGDSKPIPTKKIDAYENLED